MREFERQFLESVLRELPGMAQYIDIMNKYYEILHGPEAIGRVDGGQRINVQDIIVDKKDAADIYMVEEFLIRVFHRLGELKPPVQEAVERLYFRGESVREVAEEMKVTERTIKTWKNVVLFQLEELFDWHYALIKKWRLMTLEGLRKFCNRLQK